MTIEIKLGTIYDNYISMGELLRLHVEELTSNKELMVLNPDLDTYMILEGGGKTFSYFVYDDNRVVGYSINIVNKHLHYSDLICANNDVLFLHKDYRKSNIGRKLISLCEEEAKRRGAQMYLLHSKPNTPLEALAPYLGYSVQDTVHSKVL
jgi:GNAT superfamily N-acetyltransferase